MQRYGDVIPVSEGRLCELIDQVKAVEHELAQARSMGMPQEVRYHLIEAKRGLEAVLRRAETVRSWGQQAISQSAPLVDVEEAHS